MLTGICVLKSIDNAAFTIVPYCVYCGEKKLTANLPN
jgi:hypothetical protein